MCHKPGSYNFRLRQEKRQLTTRRPDRYEEIGVRDVWTGSFSKIKIRGKQLAFSWGLPTATLPCVSG